MEEKEKEKSGKKALIALIIIILLLLVALVWFLFFFKWPQKAETPKAEVKTEQPAPVQLPVVEETIATSVKQLEIVADQNAPAADQRDVELANLEKLASLFAERLGSYSNQSDYGNIVDLKVFMTDSMKEWADSYVAKAKADGAYDGVYRGTMTRAISAQVSSFDDKTGTAKAMVQTQKIESSDAVDNEEVYYEDLAIEFKKEGSSWLVDYAKWQGRKDN
jgi:hypothetical protein